MLIKDMIQKTFKISCEASLVAKPILY